MDRSPQGPVIFTPPRTHRPTFIARQHLVASGHYLASAAGFQILERGGNAVDAGVAAGLCIDVLQPDMCNFGGVAPIIIYLAETQDVVTISGLGRWPRKASVAYFKERYGGRIPPGLPRAVTPAAADAWLTALERFGTKSFAEVVGPALELAEHGFPVHQFLYDNVKNARSEIERHPLNAALFFPGGQQLGVGEILRQPDLARTFRRLCDAEARARRAGGSREDGLRAARDLFYRGEIAQEIAAFSRENGGLIEYDDLANFAVRVEQPVTTNFRGYDVYACGPWCQGPVFPQALNILEGYDLQRLEHNSAKYLHLLISALDAAFADRHAYYGDPDFVRVPIRGLLSKTYAAEWRERIRPDRAWTAMPAPGDPWKHEPATASPTVLATPAPLRVPPEPDTSYCCAVDRWGNGFSATPSDGCLNMPLIPGLGFILSGRGYQSWVDEQHPARIEGGKRPRLTPSPALVLKDGRLEMVLGTPGHDVQPQAMVQVLLNIIEFGMDPQAAVEQPRVASYNFPGSGDPHPYFPGTLRAEGRLPDSVCDALREMGHTVERWPDWIATAGAPCLIRRDLRNGTLLGGADPRRMSYAIGW